MAIPKKQPPSFPSIPQPRTNPDRGPRPRIPSQQPHTPTPTHTGDQPYVPQRWPQPTRR